MKIALGTAQFGLPYGAFNQTGQVDVVRVRGILDFAQSAGISVLDTAHAYGDSESILGQVGAAERFRVVTKIPALRQESPAEHVRQTLFESLAKLKTEHVSAVLLHQGEDLVSPHGPALWRALEVHREAGYIGQLGVSAHDPETALQILNRYPIDLIQLPLNIFDTRYIDNGALDACKELGVAVHARSVFLQGFALSDPKHLPVYLQAHAPLLGRFRAHCGERGISPLQGAIGYVASIAQIDKIVVGVDGVEHLQKIVAAAKYVECSREPFKDFSCLDGNLIDPSRWLQ